MRWISVAVSIVIAAVLALGILGCGGGGGGNSGGTPQPSQYGDVTVDQVNKSASYVPNPSVAASVTMVWATFGRTNGAASPLDNKVILFHLNTTGKWTLDISQNSPDFPAAVTGDFIMTTYAQLNSNAIVTIGDTHTVTIDVSGGGGPPPPPF